MMGQSLSPTGKNTDSGITYEAYQATQLRLGLFRYRQGALLEDILTRGGE